MICDQKQISYKISNLQKSEDNLSSGLRISTASELKLQDEVLDLKKKLNHQDNEHKRDKAVLEQKIELLNLYSQEYQKREENLKKMNETIMNSFNDISTKGASSKIFKEIQLNYEKHNKELLEGRARLQQTIISLEGETRELKDEVNKYRLIIKDLEIQIEKERINNERAQEVNFLDRTLMEKDIQKQQFLTEEEFQITKLKFEQKIQEMSFQQEQILFQQRDQFEQKMKQMNSEFEKEKFVYEQRLQKNLNTIQKYQFPIKSQNEQMNTSTITSRLEVSQSQNQADIEIELRTEIIRIQKIQNTTSIELQQQQSQNLIKDEKIQFLQLKMAEQSKEIENLKQIREYKIKFKEFIFKLEKEQRIQKSFQLFLHKYPLNWNWRHKNSKALKLSDSLSIESEQNRSKIQLSIPNEKKNNQIQAGIHEIPNQKQMILDQGEQQRSNELGNTNSLENISVKRGIMQNDLHPRFLQKMYSYNDQTSPELFQQSNSINKNFQIQLGLTDQNCDKPSKFMHLTKQKPQNNPININQIQKEIELEEFQQNIDLKQTQIRQKAELLQNQTDLRSEQQIFLSISEKDTQLTDDFLENKQSIQRLNSQTAHNYIDTNQNQQNFNFPFQIPEFIDRTPSCQTQSVIHFFLIKPNFILYQSNSVHRFERGNSKSQKPLSQVNIKQNQNGEFLPILKQKGVLESKRISNHSFQILQKSPSNIQVQQGQRNQSLNLIENQSLYISKSMTNNNMINSYKTLLLCENCGQCFIPSDLIDHMALCDPNLQGIQIGTKQSEEIDLPDPFSKIIGQLNYEKQLVEQRLIILENNLNNCNNIPRSVAQDRDRLKKDLDQIKLVLGKANMNYVVQSEEQEACNVALKNEITYLVKKLLKSKGQLQDNQYYSNNNIHSFSYFEGERSPLSQKSFEIFNSSNKGQHRNDYSNFSIKGCVDFNTYQNPNFYHSSQGNFDQTYFLDSAPDILKQSKQDYQKQQESKLSE